MTLTDERITRMREHVLTGVDADVTRRGRRARRVLGAGAAACFVVVIGGLGLTALVAGLPGGPIGPSSSGDSSTVETAPDPGAAERDSSGLSGSSDAAESEGAGSEESGSDGPDLTTQPRAEQDVVVTGTIDATVDQPREAAAQLATWVSSRQGRVDSRAEREDGGRSSAHLTIRVPLGEVDAALAELDEVGDVTRVDVDREDVAAQRRDLEARIESLEVSVKRLEGILAEADDSADLLATERAIQERQGELESLQGQKEALADQVSLSTLTVNLTQTDGTVEEPEDGRDGFLEGLRSGWDALVTTSTHVVRVAGLLVPWLGVAAVAYGSWRLVRRTRSSRQ
ncbi:DUF4349 domain-containing protein [Aeromicrobium sp. CTD01-1L150]|uniref:DUF4349 domain-containing protein n=1 Tax=Aeromicrobium sp. CTD01-1L150 TaxID=3341830 RepID=UPI0035C1376A